MLCYAVPHVDVSWMLSREGGYPGCGQRAPEGPIVAHLFETPRGYRTPDSGHVLGGHQAEGEGEPVHITNIECPDISETRTACVCSGALV
jgi:hypothetical protein